MKARRFTKQVTKSLLMLPVTLASFIHLGVSLLNPPAARGTLKGAKIKTSPSPPDHESPAHATVAKQSLSMPAFN